MVTVVERPNSACDYRLTAGRVRRSAPLGCCHGSTMGASPTALSRPASLQQLLLSLTLMLAWYARTHSASSCRLQHHKCKGHCGSATLGAGWQHRKPLVAPTRLPLKRTSGPTPSHTQVHPLTCTSAVVATAGASGVRSAPARPSATPCSGDPPGCCCCCCCSWPPRSLWCSSSTYASAACRTCSTQGSNAHEHRAYGYQPTSPVPFIRAIGTDTPQARLRRQLGARGDRRR